MANGIRVGHKRYYELVAQRKPLDKERAVYESKPVPAWLQTKLDTSDAQFAALTKILRGHEQKIGEIQARYQCQRDTFGKLWAGAAPDRRPATGRPAHRPEPRFPSSNPRSATMFDPKLMAGQRILVTGGGTGLGQAMAEQFLRLGADVAICGRRKAVCDATAEAWRAQFPERRIDTFGVDIRAADAVDAMVEALWQSGGLTGLVNNAAGNFVSPTESLSSRGFDAIANIVFHGSFYVTQAVGKRWVAEAKAGEWTTAQPCRNVMSIIVTWVNNGSPYVVPSAMSKAGIEVMTKSLAIEWARYGIRLNAVGPGEIPTEGMSKRLSPGQEPGARMRETNPMARPGKMSELQNLAAFLMAPGQCDWLTGQSIFMDGGRRARQRGQLLRAAKWSESDWKTAREMIEAQNAKDKAQR